MNTTTISPTQEKIVSCAYGSNSETGAFYFYITGYPDKKMFGKGKVKNDLFYGTTYCDPDTVHYSCGYSNVIHCPQLGAYTDKVLCTRYYGAVYMNGGVHRYQVDVEGLPVTDVVTAY